MAGWQLQGLDLRGHTDVLRRLDARGALVLGGRLDPAAEDDLRRAGPWCSRRCRTCPSTPTARVSTPRRSCTTGWRRGLRGHPRRAGLRLVPAHRARPERTGRAVAARPRGRRRAGGVDARSSAGRRDGRACPGARRPRLRGRRAAGPVAGTGRSDRGHRRWPGCHGGREPRRLPRRPRRRRARRGPRPARRRAVLRAVRRRLGPVGDRRTTEVAGRHRRRWACRPGSTGTSRRTRSRTPSRSTSRTPSARTCCCTCAGPAWCTCRAAAAPCRRCSRTPARTTTRPTATWRRWCSWAGRTGPRSCPPGRCCAGSPRGGRWRTHVHLVDDLDEVAGLLADPARLDG